VALLAVPTVVVLTTQPLHVVSGTLRIAPNEPDLLSSEPEPFNRETYKYFMQTQAFTLLNDQNFISSVVHDLNSRKPAFFSNAEPSAKPTSSVTNPTQSGWEILREAIADGTIRAAPIPDTELLEVTMVSENSAEAMTIVNSLLRHYVDYYNGQSVRAQGDNIDRLQTDSKRLQANIIQEQKKLNLLNQKQNSTMPVSGKSTDPEILGLQSQIELDKEFYGRLHQRLNELKLQEGYNFRRSRIQIASDAYLKGGVDHRLQWIFVTIGTVVVLSLILLLARYLLVSQRYAFQRPFGRPPAHATDA
jgi:hypothetical protein